jgi:hypothetical protein
MKKNIKIISLSLALFIAFLFSCGSDGAENTGVQNDSENGAAIQATDAETIEQITYEVPELDCGGYTFKAVVRDGYMGMYWVTVDMYAEAENGEPINDAVYRRNMMLEQKFNISIQEIRQDDVLTYVQKIIQSGSDDFDVLYPHMQQAGVLIQRGQILNLYEVPHLNFDKPWWDKSANASMTVGNKLYSAAGNITTTTNDATWTVLFNKDLARDYEIEDLYKIVKDGKWTMDVLHANSRKATSDLNGDGILEPEDQWGAVGQHECAYSLFAASGQRVIEKNADDMPELALNSNRTVSVLTKVIDFLSDGTAQIKADDFTSRYANVWDEITTKVFNESRALYLVTNFDMVKTLRNMEANFGILPLPKYDEAQPQYYSTMQYNNATVMCVPVTASDLDRTGAILEAWAAESVNTLTKAYYDITLKSKHARDDESSEMLDLIFSTRVIDQGMLFNWSGVQDFFQGFSQRKNVDFTSQYERSEPRWLTAIEKTVDAIVENN